MSKYLSVLMLVAILAVVLVFPLTAEGAVQRVTNLSFDDVIGILETFIDWMFIILMLLAVIMLIWAGFTYVRSEGNDEEVTKAHKTVIYALVAIGVAILSEGMIYLIEELVGY